MQNTFEEAENTNNEGMYMEALKNFLETNGADIPDNKKEEILSDPDRFVYFTTGEDGLEVTLKNPDKKQ